MNRLSVAFDNPWWPWLLAGLVAALVVMWTWSFHSLSGLGSRRRIFALLFRSVVMLLLVLALADMQLLRTNESLTVIYLLDQSASIPANQRQGMLNYVVREVEAHRQDAHQDRASVIVFGREANIEIPPLDDNLPLYGRLESASNLRTDATNLESAMKLAQATFPEDSAGRLVVISDGNQNIGRGENIAAELAKNGVGIDVVPVELTQHPEVAVERVAIPSNLRKGQPFDATVVVDNLSPVTETHDGVVTGRLKLTRRIGQRHETLDERDVTLPPGKSVFAFADEIERPDFYEYEATFSAADAANDLLAQNNSATGFTFVRGKGNVLLIEDWENRHPDGTGDFDYLVQRLRANKIDVTVQFTDSMFSRLADLQRFDAVILANTPKSSGTTADNLANFGKDQVEILVRNTQQLGCGLIMMGGENAMGAGGWANSRLEQAMPVDFKIRNTKIMAVGALVMIMHASELAEGNFWQKEIGREALRSLGPHDYCGIVHWNGNTGKEGWLWGAPQGLVQVGPNRSRMLAKMDRMSPGDMPEFDPAMKIAAAAFGRIKAAAIKHMIIISDGDPSAPSRQVITQLKRLGVKVSTVAVGTHGPAGSGELRRIAQRTGGKYWVVRNPKALPRIYQREARRVARPLIVERELQPQIAGWHEILVGIEEFPPISGFVMSTIKSNPLVEAPLLSPFPVNSENASLLATWQYGLGRSVAFTTDAGHRWAKDWTSWEGYDKFFTQLVRWAMRPAGDTGNFSVSTQIRDGRIQVVVDALDKDDEFVNFLDVHASVVGPTMKVTDVQLAQTAPGRYVGEFPSDRSGSHFVTINPGAGQAAIRTGVNVPYPAEYRDRETNQALLSSLASLQPRGGATGKLIPVHLESPVTTDTLEVNTFRRDFAKTISNKYVWPWLVMLAGFVFFGDVLIRRVAVNFDWVKKGWTRFLQWILRRERPVEPDVQMARLRSRKAAVHAEIDERKSATRFEPTSDDPVDPGILDQPSPTATGSPPATTGRQGGLEDTKAEEDDFATRLKKAKQQALKKKHKRSE